MSKASNAKGKYHEAPQEKDLRHSSDEADKVDNNTDSKADRDNEPPLLQNKVGDGSAKPPLAAKPSPNESSKVFSMTESTSNSDSESSSSSTLQDALKRRATDSSEGQTIDSVRELLLGDSLKRSHEKLALVEKQTNDRVGSLREELGLRIDRVVRALSSVNLAVQKENSEREEAVRDTAAAVEAKSDALATKTEDRLSFLEAKIYTVVADMERKVQDSQVKDKDKLVEQLAASNLKTEERLDAMTADFESQLKSFGERISREVSQVSEAALIAQTKAGTDAEKLSKNVDEKLSAVETKLKDELGAMRTDLGSSADDLKTQLRMQSNEQKAALESTQKETDKKLRDHVDNLEGRKVSRNDFSTLLQELATRMDDENKPVND